MKARSLLTAQILMALLSARGQVTLELQLPHNQFLRNEVLPVQVRVTNRSGQSLKIGETVDWLTFTVEDRSGKAYPPVQDIIAGGRFDLDSAASVTKVIDISSGYDFNTPGRYRVTATARFPELKLAVTSQTEAFDVIRGTQLWDEVCGVPTTNGAPRLIRYALLQALTLNQLRAFVRIADEPEESFARVVPLGPIVSFATPEKHIDRESRLHLLYQSGSRLYDYYCVTPKADLATHRSYASTGSRPRLKVQEDGTVTVLGGTQIAEGKVTERSPDAAQSNNVPGSRK